MIGVYLHMGYTINFEVYQRKLKKFFILSMCLLNILEVSNKKIKMDELKKKMLYCLRRKQNISTYNLSAYNLENNVLNILIS